MRVIRKYQAFYEAFLNKDKEKSIDLIVNQIEKNTGIDLYPYDELFYIQKEIIKDMVDGKIDDSKSIRGQLGVPFYRANGILNQFWGRFPPLSSY